METQIITITKQDLHDYFKTLSNKCKIWKVRSRIYNAMPYLIKAEFKGKKNDLVCIDEEKGIYRIVAKVCSEDLANYLNNFNFILTKDENSI